MRIKIPTLLILFTVVCSAAAQVTNLEQRISEQLKKFGAESAGIYFEAPDGMIFTYNPDEVFHAASIMKVPVMMEVFRQIEERKLKLDQPIQLKNEFASIMDASLYSLSREDDDDPDFYQNIGKSLPLRLLVEHMINRSSNLATNLVIQLVSADKVLELMREIGANDMTVLRGVEDEKAYEAGKNNTTSARALALCLKAILDPNRFREDSRREMMEILLSQQFTEGIPTGISAKERGLQVANKTGNITEISHDAAIIQDSSGQTFILVILTRGVPADEDGQRLVATLAKEIWDTLVR